MKGTFVSTRPIESLSDRNELMQKIMSEVAQLVHISNVPWDPFNVELLVRKQ